MVLIRAYDPEDEENYETCGGALINSQFVLTAGHCVCIQSQYSNVPCDFYGNLKYDPKRVLRTYVGVNSERLQNVQQNPKTFLHQVEAVFKHQDWDGSGYTSPDLALIKLQQPVKFQFHGPRKALPVCLPSSKDHDGLFDSHAYVAGWGRARNKDCFTDNAGPNRHDRCRSTFIYEGQKRTGCIKDQ